MYSVRLILYIHGSDARVMKTFFSQRMLLERVGGDSTVMIGVVWGGTDLHATLMCSFLQ